LIKNKLVMMIC